VTYGTDWNQRPVPPARRLLAGTGLHIHSGKALGGIAVSCVVGDQSGCEDKLEAMGSYIWNHPGDFAGSSRQQGLDVINALRQEFNA
jgi:hypothetical protein